MTYCVKIITSRYFKEFKNMFNQNVIRTLKAQHCNLLIVLEFFTIRVSLLLVTCNSGLNDCLLFKNREIFGTPKILPCFFKCLFLFLMVDLCLQDFSFFMQKFQLERVNLQEVKRSTYDHTRKCADQLLLLGQVCG